MQIKHALLFLSVLCTVSAAAQDKDRPAASKQVLQYVEQMPAPGYDLSQYLGENLHYPDTARKYDIEGRVIVKFVVNEDGAISDCQVVKGIGGGCDEEALWIVKHMPAWKTPGMQDGKKVKVYFNLPIVFKLTD